MAKSQRERENMLARDIADAVDLGEVRGANYAVREGAFPEQTNVVELIDEEGYTYKFTVRGTGWIRPETTEEEQEVE